MGGEIDLTCRVDANPAPNITWAIYNNQELVTLDTSGNAGYSVINEVGYSNPVNIV